MNYTEKWVKLETRSWKANLVWFWQQSAEAQKQPANSVHSTSESLKTLVTG